VSMIVSKFRSHCKSCGATIAVGDRCEWIRGFKGVRCTRCVSGSTPLPARSSTPVAKSDSAKRNEPAPHFTEVIDWDELKSLVLPALESGEFRLKNARNRETLQYYTSPVPERFTGYSTGQVTRWIREGYSVEALRTLQEFSPPLREKKRLQYVEDGDEIHIDRIYGGDDNFMSSWTKRENLPGASIEFMVSFVSTTPPQVVNAYNSWMSKAIYSLESAGIDCEVTLSALVEGGGWNATRLTKIRVKKENEVTDFTSISPMLSPAALRTLMFAAHLIAADRNGGKLTTGIGGYPGNRRAPFSVVYDADSRKILVYVQWTDATVFPEETMTSQLRSAIQSLMRGY
jgi:hypothetical protein